MPEKTVVRGASTKGSCSAAPTGNEIHNELLAPSEQSYTKMLCHLINNKNPNSLELEHDPELEFFYVDPKDIKDMVVGNQWLDLGLLHI